MNATFFKPSGNRKPPLFFIPGGEWSVGPDKVHFPVEADNGTTAADVFTHTLVLQGVLYGMAHDLAQEHGGLMAIAEHRFYGASLPFGPVDSFEATPDRIGVLTIEQAMLDYVNIIKHILEIYNISGAPVVCLGGSYSGKVRSTYIPYARGWKSVYGPPTHDTRFI